MKYIKSPQVTAAVLPRTRLKYLALTITSLMATSISQADVAKTQIGDLEIYKAADGGNINITMMLDTSGSMSEPYMKTYFADGDSACDINVNNNYTSGNEQSTTTPAYTRYYCLYNNTKYYDRLTRLKDAIFTLMNSPAILAKADKTKIGIGQFSSQSGSDNVFNAADGKSGKIVVPAAILDATQITKIKNAVANLQGTGGTPTAHAYAEAASYLLGTNTSTVKTYQNFFVRNSGGYATCQGFSGTTCTNWGTGWTNATLSAALLGDSVKGSAGNAGVGSSGTTYPGYYYVGSDRASGFLKSVSTSKNPSNTANYLSPLTSNSSCDGNGIYFLTDGAPNQAIDPKVVMKPALGTFGASFTVPSTGTLPQGSATGSDLASGMPEVGEFSKWLRDASKNPSNSSIRTAVVGFGSEFNLSQYSGITQVLKKPKLDPNTNLPLKDTSGNPIYQDAKNGVVPTATYYDCTKIPSTSSDAQNACQWGAKSHPNLAGVGGYGEGGFTSAQSTQDVVDSVVNFVADLDNSLPSAPSGTIVVPDDPYNAASQLPIAYYPSLQAQVAKNPAIWAGNMKKYNLNSGTLFGLSGTGTASKLFLNDVGATNTALSNGNSSSGKADPTVRDLWSDKDYTGANDQVGSGGFISQLTTPTTTVNNVRTVYLEDWKSATDKTTYLRKFGVNASGKVTLDGNPLSTSNTFNDTTTYTDAVLRNLLTFLGFSGFNTTAAVSSLTLTPPASANKVVGATIHSAPSSLSYSATLNTDGTVGTTRDDYVIFGSSDGALHMVDADNAGTTNGGKEIFAFIPRQIILNQPAALANGSSTLGAGGVAGSGVDHPYVGIDAPWLVATDYSYNYNSTTQSGSVAVDTSNNKGAYAYGGLRMGGEAIYGLDLTAANTGAPTLLFSITPTTTNFSRMGQIWAKPTKAKIKTSATDTGTDVLIFGGGYDTCYENEGFQIGVTNASFVNDVKGATCSNKAEAQGDAVYMVNAHTGALIWSASSSGSPTTSVPTMKNSIVGGITALDRDGDGFIDQLYFADLGGQVFRADFVNAGMTSYGGGTTTTPTTGFTNTRVTRVLKSAYDGNTTNAPYTYRFYEAPVVSFYRNTSSANTNSGKLFALINVISGDRSSPLSKIRTTNTYADRVYGIIDTDVTTASPTFYASTFGTSTKPAQAVDIADTDLVQVPSALQTASTASTTSFTDAQKNTVMATMQSGSKKGWYYPLTRFDGYNNVRYNKGVGGSIVIGNMLYTTVYNPDMVYDTGSSCAAKIVGGSERELYCLPYGICAGSGFPTGTGGFIRAGRGIQDMTLGPASSTSSGSRTLIGLNTLAESVNNRVAFNSDAAKTKTDGTGIASAQGLQAADQALGDGTAPSMTYISQYTLTPKTWYEASQ